MNIKDATLMMLAESAGQPVVGSLAQTAYEGLQDREEVDYRLLKELIDEASGKGVLRALRARYGPAGFEAIVGPILAEIGCQAPVPPRRPARDADPETDPLRAAAWPPR